MNRRSLLSVVVFLGMLFTGIISANADARLEIQSLSAEFNNPGLHLALSNFEHSNLGLNLALGQSQGSESLSTFAGKGGAMSALSFSVFSVPECRIDPSTVTTPSHAPEPATMLLLGTGLAGVAGFIRHRRRIKR